MAKNVKFQIRAEDKTTTAFRAVKGNLKSVTGAIGGMKTALLGIGAAVGGIYAIGKGLEAVTSAAMKQRESEEKLASVLKATGGAVGYNVDELKKMASAFQSVTTYGDEVVLEGMSILATFKNIKGQAFEAAAKAALDMSTIMKQDLKSSMVQVGKALNDPVAGLTALSRVGVTFTEQQKEMIKAMSEAGDVAGAQAIILQELESQFGGASENVAPFQKALKQLQNVWGDLLESIGFGLTENEAFVELLNQAKVYISQLIPYVDDLVADFITWIGPADQLGKKLDTLLRTAKAMIWPFQKLAGLLDKVGSFIGTGAAMAVTGVENLMQGRLSLEPHATGTGATGVNRDQMAFLHRGEVVLNPAEAQSYRANAGGVNITIAPTFMSGDRNAARAVADEINKALKDLKSRWGS